MRYIITEFEREAVIEDAKSRVSRRLWDVLMQDKKYLGLWNAVFSNYIAKTSQSPYDVTSMEKTVNPEQLRHNLQDFFEMVIRLASEETGQSYSTGQVAEFFGVSIQTVHNWIGNERLSGFDKPGAFKQTRIPDTAIWTATSGEKMTVREVVAMYQKEKAARPAYPDTKQAEAQAIRDEIGYFVRKYGNSFDETLGRKVEQHAPLSQDEQRDADEWLYWLDRLERIR